VQIWTVPRSVAAMGRGGGGARRPVGTHPHLLVGGAGAVSWHARGLCWMSRQLRYAKSTALVKARMYGELLNYVRVLAPRSPARLVRYFFSARDTP
jgi:hypothetical protein